MRLPKLNYYNLNTEEQYLNERLIVKLSIDCDILPNDLVIHEGHCTNLRRVLHGGFGEIYRATLEGQDVAIKLVCVGHEHGCPEDILKIRRVILFSNSISNSNFSTRNGAGKLSYGNP
jgi:hypothetical protein